MSKKIDLSTSDGIKSAIASIGRRGKKLDNDIQDCGLACIAHIEAHGDVTLFESLYDNMPKGSRRNALVAWGIEFGKVRLLTEAEIAKLKAADKPVPTFKYDGKATTNLAGATDMPWTEFKPEPSPAEAMDVMAAIEALIKKANGKAGIMTGQEAMLEELTKIGKPAEAAAATH